jgi:hypothetical protein
MMSSADRDEILQVGRASLGPMGEVVGLNQTNVSLAAAFRTGREPASERQAAESRAGWSASGAATAEETSAASAQPAGATSSGGSGWCR